MRGVQLFARCYVGPRMRRAAPQRVIIDADNAIFAWAQALRSLGRPIPEWSPPRTGAPLPALLAEYVAFRRQQRGIAGSTIVGDVAIVREFIELLRSRGRSVRRPTVGDLDAFVEALGRRQCRRTVRDNCSRLRAFLRFLRMTGRINGDLSSFVVAPRVRRMEQPPRALPWAHVQRLLRSVPRDRPIGLRDYALLLLLAAYGFGAAEAVALRLEDIDWKGGVVRLQRPKTGAPLELPLLPAVARALVAYLRRGRPADAGIRQVFVSARLPRRPLSTAAVRHLVCGRAAAAGLAGLVSGHSLRHTHATRQIDAGVNPKIVGDILGHRRPSSTSVYARVALRHLRSVALPVPR